VTESDELERLEPFKSLSTGGLALLRQGLVRKSSSGPALILQKGDRVSGVYIVLSGRLRVFVIAPNGTEATLYFVNPGEACVLTLNCLFNDLRYPAWVKPETQVNIAQIPGNLYRRLFETESAIQNLTVKALSSLVYRLMAELEQVHSCNHRQRLAQFLLLHTGSDGALRITQQQLADHLGTTREVVARLIQGFVAQGLVKTNRGLISICDMASLRTAFLGKAEIDLVSVR
jgi:CRP/FNR family transcriptional regulator